ncbi:hypothetical protein ACJ41O_004525 [Fusarium nematophilum]
MEGSPTYRRQPSPVDFPKPYKDPFESTTEGHGDDAQPPAEAVARSPSSSSTPSMRDSVTTNVHNTSSIGSGSSVTQLTHDDDASGIKSNPRDKISREPKHHKTKAAHRLSGLSASESEPYPVTHGALPSPNQNTVHLKSRTKYSPGTASTLSSTSGAAFVQSPISPSLAPSWASGYPSPGYPPFYDPTTARQQPGSAPIDPQYYPGFNYMDPNSTPSAGFVHYPPSYYPPPSRAHDDMAPRDRGRIRDDSVILPLEEMTGYAKLAGTLTGQLRPRVPPLYRQFQWLSHRLLLSYQDRLAELEEILMHHDTTDTEMRARDGRRGRIPASERDERENESQFLFDKRKTMREIGLLLDKYTDDLISLAPVPATDPSRAQRQGPQPDLISRFSVLGLVLLAILLVVLPDLKGRLTAFLCLAALGVGVLGPTVHLRQLLQRLQLRQLFEYWFGGP